MAATKEIWYVLVLSDTGPKFLTDVGNSEHYAKWEATGKPVSLGKPSAKDVAFGLSMNGFNAYPICVPYEITRQIYDYKNGEFRWVEF